jgi:hypothetical protein
VKDEEGWLQGNMVRAQPTLTVPCRDEGPELRSLWATSAYLKPAFMSAKPPALPFTVGSMNLTGVSTKAENFRDIAISK